MAKDGQDQHRLQMTNWKRLGYVAESLRTPLVLVQEDCIYLKLFHLVYSSVVTTNGTVYNLIRHN